MFNFRRFLALFRPELYTPFELALRALARRQYDEALALLDMLLLDAELPRAQRAAVANKRGVALVQLGNLPQARAAFEHALDIVPAFAPALTNLGNLHLEAGEIDEAIRLYEAALVRDHSYGLAHHNLGVAYKRAGRRSEAVAALRRARRLEGGPGWGQRK